jgi:hypothetical protein
MQMMAEILRLAVETGGSRVLLQMEDNGDIVTTIIG